MSKIKAVRDYIEACPLLNGSAVNINYLGQQLPSYSIDNVARKPIIKQYCDGSQLRQCCYVFARRDCYDEDRGLNLEVAEFLENFTGWIEEQNDLGIFPKFESETEFVKGIEVESSGAFSDASRGSVRYEIRFKVIYRKEAI